MPSQDIRPHKVYQIPTQGLLHFDMHRHRLKSSLNISLIFHYLILCCGPRCKGAMAHILLTLLARVAQPQPVLHLPGPALGEYFILLPNSCALGYQNYNPPPSINASAGGATQSHVVPPLSRCSSATTYSSSSSLSSMLPGHLSGSDY